MVYYQLQGNIKRKTHHEYVLKVQKTYIQERAIRAGIETILHTESPKAGASVGDDLCEKRMI